MACVTLCRYSGSFHFCFSFWLTCRRVLSAMGTPLFQAGWPGGRPRPRRAGLPPSLPLLPPVPSCCCWEERAGKQGMSPQTMQEVYAACRQPAGPVQHTGGVGVPPPAAGVPAALAWRTWACAAASWPAAADWWSSEAARKPASGARVDRGGWTLYCACARPSEDPRPLNPSLPASWAEPSTARQAKRGRWLGAQTLAARPLVEGPKTRAPSRILVLGHASRAPGVQLASGRAAREDRR